MFRFSFGRRTLLGLGDSEAIAAALRDRSEGFFRRTRQLETIGDEMGLAPGVFGANGKAWKNQRRMVTTGFHPAHVKAYFPSLLTVKQRLRAHWQPAVAGRTPLALQPGLMRFTVDVIAGLAFGADINTLESDDDVIQRHLDEIFPALIKRIFSFLSLQRYVRLPADRQLERSMGAVNEAIEGFIAQARAGLTADPARRTLPPNLLEAMIVAAGAGDGSVTDGEVASNVMTMLLVGEDTTANTLIWLSYLLHRHPAALQCARAEVHALGADSATFTSEQMAGLDYLEACAHETMRLKPVAPFQVIEARRDTVVAGMRVPAGTGVWCVMRGHSVDARHFPISEAFEPRRWLSEGEANEDHSASSAKRVSMPFGGGPRVCPGRYLALLEIMMAMAMLLTHFDTADVTTPDGGEAREHMAFTMAPVGLRMTLRPRD